MVEYKKYTDMPEELQERLQSVIINFKLVLDEYPALFQFNLIILFVYDFLLDCEDPYEMYEIFVEALNRTMENHKKRTELE